MRTLVRSLLASLVVSAAVFLGMLATARGSGFSGSGGGGGPAGIVGAEIHHTASISLASGVAQTVDTYATTTRNQGCSVGLSAGSITAPFTGTYMASVAVHWQDNGDTVLQNASSFWVNGAGTVPTGQAIPNTCTNHGENTRATQALSLTAGDVVTVRVIAYTNGGGAHGLDTVDFSLDLFASSTASFSGGNLSSGLTWRDGGTYTPAAPELLGPLDMPFVLQGRAGNGGQVVEFFHSKGISNNVTTSLFTVDAGNPDQGCGGVVEYNFYASDNASAWENAGGFASFRVIRSHAGTVTAGVNGTTNTGELPVGNGAAGVVFSTTTSGSTATIKVNVNGGAFGFVTAGFQYRVTVMGANASATTIN